MAKKLNEEKVTPRPESPKPDAPVVEIPKSDLELYGKLCTEINAGRDDFKKQLQQVREAISVRTQEIENLKIKSLKLEGAIEASEIYLKSVLPSNNPIK
jgi:hypothetical protein